jgi:SWI/SNF-related matrix-associated actin-dependent regulator 1 of chromatin subfamily A
MNTATVSTTTTGAAAAALVVHVGANDGALVIKPLDYMDKIEFTRYLGACRSAGANYNAALKAQVGKMERLGDVVAALKDGGFAVTLDPSLASAMQTAIKAIHAEADAMRSTVETLNADLKGRGLELWRFQLEGVAWLRTRTAGILADDMGLGKTVQALMAIPERAPVVVICPAAVKGNWVREAGTWRRDLYPTVLSGRNSFRWPLPNEMVILNPAILPEELTRVPRPGTVIIADEAHVFKSNKAQCSTRFRAMCKAVLLHDGGRVWEMTGTPILNRPPELWTLLTHLGLAEEAFDSWPNFCRLMGGRKSGGAMDWRNCAPLPEAADRLRRVTLRRRRVEVLPDLPTKTHTDISVSLDDDTRALCETAWQAMREAGVDFETALQTAKNESGFEVMSRVRAALATAKIPAMLEIVDEIEATGEPQVVFSAHRAPIDLLGMRPGWKTITGDIDPMERSAIVSEFQRGHLKGIAATIKAGGVGLTLTKAHQALFVDLDWTPAMNCQAEDRICRIGQDRGCIIRRLVGDHELDEHVAAKLLEKQRLIEASVEKAAVKEGGHTIVTTQAAAKLEATLADIAAIGTAPAHGVRGAVARHQVTPLGQIGPEDEAPF